jgi:hypothetical protein
VMVDIGWHVGSPTRHSAVVPDPETRWCFETVNGTLTALLFARDAGGSGCMMARDDARLCGVGFRQLRTCRRTPELLWARSLMPQRSSNHFRGSGAPNGLIIVL